MCEKMYENNINLVNKFSHLLWNHTEKLSLISSDSVPNKTKVVQVAICMNI